MNLKQSKFIKTLRKYWMFELGVDIYKSFRDDYRVKHSPKIIFHNDRYYADFIKLISRNINVSSVVETGTYLGHGTQWLSECFKQNYVYTCEIMTNIYVRAKNNLANYPNVAVFNQDSIDLLNYLKLEKSLGNKPFFFLDAHWYKKWNLTQEVKHIADNYDKAIILIDDFKVPNNPEFKYDTYDGKECSMELIEPFLNKKKKYNFIFPDYFRLYEPNYHAVDPNLPISQAGYVLIFQNCEDDFKELMKATLKTSWTIKGIIDLEGINKRMKTKIDLRPNKYCDCELCKIKKEKGKQ